MRCQYAKKDAQTFAEFTFEHKGKRYQFYRYLRPTRRKDLKVEPEKLEKILEAAHVAPTAANLQPVRLIVAQSKSGNWIFRCRNC